MQSVQTKNSPNTPAKRTLQTSPFPLRSTAQSSGFSEANSSSKDRSFSEYVHARRSAHIQKPAQSSWSFFCYANFLRSFGIVYVRVTRLVFLSNTVTSVRREPKRRTIYCTAISGSISPPQV